MAIIATVFIGIMAFQTIQSMVCPATLKAIALLQHQKAMAMALKARAHYNAALARANLALHDHRIPRDAEDSPLDSDQSYFSGQQDFRSDYGDITKPQTPEDIEDNCCCCCNCCCTEDVSCQQEQDCQGMEYVAGNAFLGPDTKCACDDSTEDLNADENLQLKNLGDDMVAEKQGFQQKNIENQVLLCQRLPGQPSMRLASPIPTKPSSADPILGMQLSPQQAFGQAQMDPMFFNPHFIPDPMQNQMFMPHAYQGFLLQPTNPGFGNPMIFLREATPANDLIVTPQYIQPGFNATSGAKIVQIVPGNMYNPYSTPSFTSGNNMNHIGPINPSYAQSQIIAQGRNSERLGMNIPKNMEHPKRHVDEKVGTMADFSMRAPEFPDNLDPMKPQNLQPVVNYIERQEGNMRKMLHAIEENENVLHHFGSLMNMDKFVSSPNKEMNEQLQDKRLGTIPLESLDIPPLPNFLDPTEQQESVKKTLEEEQERIHDFLNFIEENNRHNMDSLSNLLHNPVDFQSGLTESSESTSSQEQDGDSNLGNIINIPLNKESDWLRFARAINKTDIDKADQLLQAEKEMINELKTDAKHDEDLMMIGYIGENMINELEKRKNDTKRSKRDIGSFYTTPLTRLIDPRYKLDMPKTLDNIGVAAKNALEHEKAPLYHLRNMMGSAQDAVMATMKIPTKNFLIPSTYDVVGRGNENTLIQKKLEQNYQSDLTDTFQKVGSAVRGCVLSGQEALSHVGQAANHAKCALHSTKYVAPRLMLKQIPAISREPRKKAVLLTPRILDLADDEENIGNILDNSRGEFIKVGNIMDAVGISNPNYNNLAFKKIIIEPKNSNPLIGSRFKSSPSQKLQEMLGSIREEDFKNEENEEMVGDTLNTLKDVKEAFGVNSLKEIFDTVKKDLQEALNMNTEPKINANNMKPKNDGQEKILKSFRELNEVDQAQEDEMDKIPKNPHMKKVSEDEIIQLWSEAIAQNEHSKRDKELGQILGAINPLMFEKIFNETLKMGNTGDTPHSVFHHHHDGHSHGMHDSENEYGDDVGTSMKLSGLMLKPFMGQVNDEIFKKFATDDLKKVKEAVHEMKHESEGSKWMEMEQNQIEY